MDKHAWWKWILLIGLTAWSLVLVTPVQEKVKLGLDLQGGISFLLEVDTEALEAEDVDIDDAQKRALEVIRNRVDLMGTEEPIIYPEPRSHRIVVQIPGLMAEDREWAVQTFESAAFLEFRMVHDRNDQLRRELFDRGLKPEGYEVVSFEETMPWGERVRRFYYRRVDMPPMSPDEDREYRRRLGMFQAPPGYEFMLMPRDERGGQTLYEPYFVNRRRDLTGEHLAAASVDYHQFGQPIVSLRFDGEGARRFAQVTADYAPGGPRNPDPDGQRFLAIVLDGTLYSAPFIRTPIYGGNAIIEGQFTVPEAQHLALILRAGSLPAPLRVIEERVVDPTLGRDSIESGMRAIIYGGIAVLAFMLAYYLLAGLVANLALILDLLLLPLGMLIVSGFLSLITGAGGGGGAGLPTLTLPGIAGIVLTIGIAVDANVLIFERIREEQRAGKRFINAIETGYDKVFSTIFDANVTTLLTAVILFWQGSGPIRGFAVTLAAGIVVSMYVALVVTRLMFETLAARTKIQKLKMLSILRDTKIDFLSKRFIAGALSALIIIGTATVFVMKGEENFGVDFTGGTALTYRFDEVPEIEEVRRVMAGANVADAFIQFQREFAPDVEGEFREYLLLKVGEDDGDATRSAMAEAFGGLGVRIVQDETVGAQVGEDLRRAGIMAIAFAMLGIVIYISFRFEFAFAVGAIVAVMHDVLITVGIFCLLGNQLSLPIIAALLTIVGYSVNDTIVIFDRIREDLGLYRGRNFMEIANLSINQTLSRTILTSLTTLIVVTILLIFGGGAIKDFALALFIGVISGTYSSVFVATPVAHLMHERRAAKKKLAAARA